MCKRWNWGITAHKLREKQKGLQFSPLLNSCLQTSHTDCPVLTSLLNLVKIRKLLKENDFRSVALSENIYNLVHTVNNSSDRQIGNRAIETFQDGSFGRFVEVGLLTYPKCFCPNHNVLLEKFQNWGAAYEPYSINQRPYGITLQLKKNSNSYCLNQNQEKDAELNNITCHIESFQIHIGLWRFFPKSKSFLVYHLISC